MLTETQQQLLDELTFEERSVFLYYFILKIPQKEISHHISISYKKVKKIVKFLQIEIDFVPIREKLLESFDLEP